MSLKVTAVNCIMKGIGRKDSKESYAKLKFQMTSAIREAFEWNDISGASEWEPEAPNDQFRCHFIELMPNNPELKKFALRIDAATIGDFQIQTKAKKEGKNAVKAQKRVVDVLCTVRFHGADSLAFLETYKVNANKNSEMVISYDPAPQQGEFDGTRVVPHTGEVIDGRKNQGVLQMPAVDENAPEPTAAEKKKAREAERAKFAEIRERTKKK